MMNLEKRPEVRAEIELFRAIGELKLDAAQTKAERARVVRHIDGFQLECDGRMARSRDRQLEQAIDVNLRQ